ncbi:MAG: peptidoglycan-binding domain-containing protein [Clostridiaceae bacterium]|nr:peptidoglycan-binding protein [Eubacteriales bacterium]
MASYYLSGYEPPSGVTGREDVKEYQKRLGVTADGIWGPKTQAAYEQSQTSTQKSANATDYEDYYALAMRYVEPETVKVAAFSTDELKKELQGYMRPMVDQSIARRREAGETSNAELDADAYSRGMGQSTYLSSMKERENDDVASDISMLEAQYGAALAEKLYAAMADYQNRLFEAEKFNAQQKMSAQTAARGLASDMYAASQAAQAAQMQAQAQPPQAAKKSSSSGGSKQKAVAPALSIGEIYELMGDLSENERKSLFGGQTAYWTAAREELMGSVSAEVYRKLKEEFEPRAAVSTPKAGGGGSSANYVK